VPELLRPPEVLEREEREEREASTQHQVELMVAWGEQEEEAWEALEHQPAKLTRAAKEAKAVLADYQTPHNKTFETAQRQTI